MENSLLGIDDRPVAKKMRTNGGLGHPTSTGEEINPSRKRKNRSRMESLIESPFFIKRNYWGALHEYLQKRGYGTLSCNFKPKGNPIAGRIIATCTAGDVTATVEAKGKKFARQKAALAVMKKLKLLPEGYKPPSKVVKAKVQSKDEENKTNEELFAERECDYESVYNGVVVKYKREKGFGFIAIDEPITFKGATVFKSVFAGKDDIVCYSDEIGMHIDSKVMFRIYKNSMGIGAWEVTMDDGSPIFFDPNLEEAIKCVNNSKEIKPMIKNDQYKIGNFRGALQEYLAKISKLITVEYEAERELNARTNYHVARCKVVGGHPEKFEKLVGCGWATSRKNALMYSALDYMLKLKILTKDQHSKNHRPKKDRGIGLVPGA